MICTYLFFLAFRIFLIISYFFPHLALQPFMQTFNVRFELIQVRLHCNDPLFLIFSLKWLQQKIQRIWKSSLWWNLRVSKELMKEEFPKNSFNLLSKKFSIQIMVNCLIKNCRNLGFNPKPLVSLILRGCWQNMCWRERQKYFFFLSMDLFWYLFRAFLWENWKNMYWPPRMSCGLLKTSSVWNLLSAIWLFYFKN